MSGGQDTDPAWWRLYWRGYRDGFWGREAREADEAYLSGWEHGLRAGDRTRGGGTDAG